MNAIYNLAKRPSLWQRSGQPFWDDEHISKGMLAAHLDPNWDAASRKAETIDRSVRWIASLLPQGCSVLDLGCGPGLYCSRLSRLGFRVVGMDISRRSIAYAAEADPNTEYICGDYLEMDYDCRFDAALMIYCDYAALTAPERQRLLANVSRALKPGGLFLLDVYTDAYFENKKEQAGRTTHENGGFWSAEPHVCLESNYLYENNTVEARQTIVVTEKETREYLIWDTAYSASRLRAELEPAGFEFLSLYGDICGSPYNEREETLCALVQKPGKAQARP